MRISTAGLHNSALAGINERNAALVKTQAQIASGKKIQSPADDPAGAVRALELDRSLTESQQYGRNANVVQSRLSLEESTLADATDLVERVRDLTVQANNASVDAASRQSIAKELQARLSQLVDLANRRDANGEYLFSGFATQTQPFSQSPGGAVYQGDQGERTLQTSATQFIADSHNGAEVFLDIPNGNGTFVTAASAANTGSGVIDSGSVNNPTAWVRGAYTVSFTSPTAWQVTDSTNAVVASGAYTSNNAIAFNGVQVTIKGDPAAGDTFTISPSTTEDLFTTFNNLLNTVGASGSSPAQRTLFNNQMGAALTQFDNALTHLSGVRADVGARLSLLDDTQDNRADRELELSTSVSQLRDLDYAEALTKLNLQQLGLQAAQSSYARLAQLSLFDYL